MKLQCSHLSERAHRRMAFEVSLGPLSLTIAARQEPVELASRADPGDRGIGNEGQALAGAIVDHDRDAQAAGVDELIGNEVLTSEKCTAASEPLVGIRVRQS